MCTWTYLYPYYGATDMWRLSCRQGFNQDGKPYLMERGVQPSGKCYKCHETITVVDHRTKEERAEQRDTIKALLGIN